MTTLGLDRLPGRCPSGYDLRTQHGPAAYQCSCDAADDEWSVFVAAVRSSARADGSVHQCDVRPLIRGRIEPKHIGQMWKRARRERLLVEVGHERSDDEPGKNAGRMEPYYELRAA
jgi:hypothetical protein